MMMRKIIRSVVPDSLRMQAYDFRVALRPLQFYGWSVECPYCSARYRRFFPHGTPERKNAACPRCYAVERHRLLLLYLKNRTGIFTQPMRVLHFAPERSLGSLLANQKNLHYVSTDYAQAADVQMDITRLAIPTGTFDAILCSHVLEHIPDDGAAMRELYRVLRPGGWAILQVPLDTNRAVTYEDFSITSPELRRQHFGQEDHVRWYGRDYQQRLRSAGFEVTADDYVRKLDPAIVKRHGLLLDEDIYFCSKPLTTGTS